jgi:hypothetical protein
MGHLKENNSRHQPLFIGLTVRRTAHEPSLSCAGLIGAIIEGRNKE